MKLAFKTWIDIGERGRAIAPLMWKTYPVSPFTVGEAYDLAVAGKLFMMHRHEANRVVMQIWLPEPINKKIYG